MSRLVLILGSLALLYGLTAPAAVQACPNCQDAIAASGDASKDTDPAREPRAYNHSIYLMAGMPYLLLGMLSFKIYQNVRKSNANMNAIVQALEDSPDSEGPSPTPDP